MHKIRIVSKILFIILLIAFIAMPFLYGYLWYEMGRMGFEAQNVYGMHTMQHIMLTHQSAISTDNIRIAGFCVSILPMAADMFIIYFLMRLFLLYAKGQIFDLLNVKYIRNVGITMLIWQFINPFYQITLSYIVSGQQVISFNLTNHDLYSIITAIIIILIAWIMQCGHELQEEQELTI